MTKLSSGLAGTALPVAELPEHKAHHKAKHSLLREYMHVWLPKLGYTYGKIAIVDGFAAAGRYQDGSPGSPLVMLQAYLGWKSHEHFKSPPHFVFVESKPRLANHLRSEVDAIPDLKGATVDVVHGRYEDVFPRAVEYLSTAYAQPVPTFSFVDPLGWKDNPFELIRAYRQRLGDKAEALVYVPAAFMARFAEQDFVRPSLERLYDGPTWEEAKNERTRFRAAEKLAEAYRLQLKQEFDWATRFRIDPLRRNEYYLLFGTGSKDGLRAMKAAMWKVDPVGGRAYEQSAKAAAGQAQLFAPQDIEQLPDEEALPTLLRDHFGTEEFTIEQAEELTLTQTRYLDTPHLRQWALIPLQESGQLAVVYSKRKQVRHFPQGTRMRLVD